MWYCAVGREQKGPFSDEQMVAFLRAGTITASTMVWCEGLPDWTTVSQTKLGAPANSSVPPHMQEVAAKAKVTTHIAYEKAKEATGHAYTAIRLLLVDPMGGQGQAWRILGEQKGLLAGLFCIVLYILVPLVLGYAQGLNRLSMEMKFKFVLFISLVPALVAATSYIISLIAVKRASISGALFAAGIAMLPLTVAVAVFWLVGIANFEIIIFVGIFAVTSFCLLLNAGLMQVHQVSPKIAFWTTPLIISVFLYVTKILVARELGGLWGPWM